MKVKKLQETAVKKRSTVESPLEPNLSAVRSGPRLHWLSVEHAAIAQMLDDRELQLVLALGRGERLNAPRVQARIDTLQKKTRMSLLSLAVMGYQLAGQYEYGTDVDARPAA